MTARWIEEAKGINDNDDTWEFLEPLLEKINNLLLLASTDVEDGNLQDEILKEIRHV